MRASAGITAGAIAKYVGGPSIMGASRPFFGFIKLVVVQWAVSQGGRTVAFLC